MVSRTSFVAVWLVLLACGDAAPEAGAACAEQAAAHLARGRALLDQSRDGEHYRAEGFEAAVAELRAAAESGSRDAQSLYGRTLFASLFARSAPVPAERDAYVSALVALRRAGLAGDEKARAFLPSWATDAPALDAPPLDALPRAWLDQAIADAAAPIACPGS